ncbi:MAG: cupin domain-containing protein [Halodesulfurarchaeum sp.]
MGYEKATPDDVESVVDPEVGDMRFLKSALGTTEVGVTVLSLEPGESGKEHDHTHDGQEEVYVVVDGEAEVELSDATVHLSADEALRIDAEETRQIHNRSDERAKFVLVGAPL